MLDQTRHVFHALAGNPSIHEFLLVGGTALSLLVKHRLSEDLDFASSNIRLNRRAISNIIQGLRAQGLEVKQQFNLAAQQDFEDTGLDLHDYQQDYDVDGVKLTFFSLLEEGRKVLSLRQTKIIEGIPVADIDTLFRMKSLVLTQRLTSRDLFDLHYLVTQHNYTVGQIFSTIREFNPIASIDHIKHKLIYQRLPETDPGYESLIPNGGPSIHEIRTHFLEEINLIEQLEAEKVAEAELDRSMGPKLDP